MKPSLILVALLDLASAALTSLDGTDWTISNANTSVRVTASVPGTVPDALYRAGVEGDPSFGRNQLRVLDYSTEDNFTYTRSFVTPASCVAKTSRCELIFGGVYTAANIVLNGHIIGSVRDMHLRYVFDVSEQLAVDAPALNNTLEVRITSAVMWAAAYAAANGDPGCKKRNRGPKWPAHNGHGTICSTYIRKNTGRSVCPIRVSILAMPVRPLKLTCHRNTIASVGIVLQRLSHKASRGQCGCARSRLPRSMRSSRSSSAQ